MTAIIAYVVLASWCVVLLMALSNTEDTWPALWLELRQPIQRRGTPRAIARYRGHA
jgi:hypothetical protein